jgi:uncharacterized protein
MIKATFDANIWFSAVWGGEIARKMQVLLDNEQLTILTCNNTLVEFNQIVNRSKFQKVLDPLRILQFRWLIFFFTENLPLISPIASVSRDAKDDYLLTFSNDYTIDYLITGDKDLLVLNNHGRTQIVTFSQFYEILVEKGVIEPPQ